MDPSIETPWKAWVITAHALRVPVTEAEIRRVNREAGARFQGQIFSYHGRTDEFWRLRDLWALDQLGVTHQRSEFFEALQSMFRDPTLVHLFPETVDVLKVLRARGMHVGVVSNFTDGLLPILDHHGLLRWIDSVTYSQAVGVAKPDPRIFREALRHAGRRPEEALHVGDSYESDCLGAMKAGLRGVWLNRSGAPAPGPCEEVHDLRGLLSLIP